MARHQYNRIARDDPEWHRMWEALGGDDPAARCDDCGQRWQYMGTATFDQPDASRGVDRPGRYHSFRHRHHPRTHRREYAWIPATLIPEET